LLVVKILVVLDVDLDLDYPAFSSHAVAAFPQLMLSHLPSCIPTLSVSSCTPNVFSVGNKGTGMVLHPESVILPV